MKLAVAFALLGMLAIRDACNSAIASMRLPGLIAWIPENDTFGGSLSLKNTR